MSFISAGDADADWNLALVISFSFLLRPERFSSLWASLPLCPHSHSSKRRIEIRAFPPSPYQNLIPFVVSVVVVALCVVVGIVSEVISSVAVDLFVVSVVSAVVVFWSSSCCCCSFFCLGC